MGLFTDFYASSIGKKTAVGLTGLMLCTFLVFHLAGNLLLFKDDGGAAFDAYAEFLPSLFIIRVIEIALFGVFLFHIVSGLIVWLRNRGARPSRYSANKAGETSTLFSRTMFLTGSIVFIFLVVHLRTFWVTARFQHDLYPSMYETVRTAFADPLYSLFYVVAMGVLAFHLRHGFQSAFQTFGLKTKKYGGIIEAAGVLFWLLIPVGFATVPVFFLLKA